MIGLSAETRILCTYSKVRFVNKEVIIGNRPYVMIHTLEPG